MTQTRTTRKTKPKRPPKSIFSKKLTIQKLRLLTSHSSNRNIENLPKIFISNSDLDGFEVYDYILKFEIFACYQHQHQSLSLETPLKLAYTATHLLDEIIVDSKITLFLRKASSVLSRNHGNFNFTKVKEISENNLCKLLDTNKGPGLPYNELNQVVPILELRFEQREGENCENDNDDNMDDKENIHAKSAYKKDRKPSIPDKHSLSYKLFFDLPNTGWFWIVVAFSTRKMVKSSKTSILRFLGGTTSHFWPHKSRTLL